MIAVFINAGLLAVLLVAALMTQDEVVAPSPSVIAQKIEDKSLFSEAIDLPMPEIKQEESLVHKLPPLSPEPVAVAEPPAAPAPAPVIAAAPVVAEPIVDWKVQKGDNLDKIAKINHTTVDQIIKLNRLSGSVLQIGQVLKIPKSTVAAAPKPAVKKEPLAEYYTVKVGDTPWTIAMKSHIKVDELLRLNAMNEEKARKLKPGDRLRIR